MQSQGDDEPHGERVHRTSTGLQIITVSDNGPITKVLIDERTRGVLVMDDVQWRELEMYVIAHHGIEANHNGASASHNGALTS